MQKLLKIDMHMHTSDHAPVRRLGGAFASPAEMRAIYDRIGVERGVVLPLASPEWSMSPITSFDAERAVSLHPETCGWWFAYVDPRACWNDPDADLGGFLGQLAARGAMGLGEVTCNLPFDDPMARNLFRHAERLGLPMTVHIGQHGNDYGLIDTLGLPGLERTLADFPGLRVIGHSQKFWSEISGGVSDAERGGYPAGRVLPGGRVPALLRRRPNLYADLSAGSGYNAVTRDPDFGYAFLEEFADRLLFAVDVCDPSNIESPMCRLSAYLDEAAETGRISYSAYRKISRDNALALLERGK